MLCRWSGTASEFRMFCALFTLNEGRFLICSDGSVRIYMCEPACSMHHGNLYWLTVAKLNAFAVAIRFTNNAGFELSAALWVCLCVCVGKVCGNSHEIFIAECKITALSSISTASGEADMLVVHFHACIHLRVCACGLHKMPMDCFYIFQFGSCLKRCWHVYKRWQSAQNSVPCTLCPDLWKLLFSSRVVFFMTHGKRVEN